MNKTGIEWTDANWRAKSIYKVLNRHPFSFFAAHCLDQLGTFLTLFVKLAVRISLTQAIERFLDGVSKFAVADFHADIVAELCS